MKALLLLIFAIPVYIFPSLIFFNSYDNTGYFFEEGRLIYTFNYQGTCTVFKDEIAGIYTPPDADINFFLSFPEKTYIVLKSGKVLGRDEADINIPIELVDYIKKDINDIKVMCDYLPLKFENETKVVLYKNLTFSELGLAVSSVLNSASVVYEVPLKETFQASETVDLSPRPPIVTLDATALNGQGVLSLAFVRDFSNFDYSYKIDGIVYDSSSLALLLPPGTHLVTLVATDSFGLTSLATVSMYASPFVYKTEKLKVEIGYPVDSNFKAILPKEALFNPGKYIVREMKPYGLYTFLIEATDSIRPKLIYSVDRDKIDFDATDVNGVVHSVFVNGVATNKLMPGENLILLVAEDGYGNVNIKHFKVYIKKSGMIGQKFFKISKRTLRTNFVLMIVGDSN
ncbi:MAG: hypothetical protein J7L34_09240 [Thermotogaceae bacterium]|nr:hypothetical protein [Thermotogaceae bacterium]